MPTECWFRNPHGYVREMAECGEMKIAWDRGTLQKRRIDPVLHAGLYFGENANWQILVVGEQGTAHLDKDHPISKPLGVYPTWQYGESSDLLEEMFAFPLGQDVDACVNIDVEPDERPVYNQAHKVILTGMPNLQHIGSRSIYKLLAELQGNYPEVQVHFHGAYSWNVAFGQGWYSADVDPRVTAQKGKITLPPGKEILWERSNKVPQWINVCGFQVVDLKVPRNRCMYNIKSAVWAAENWEANVKFKSRSLEPLTEHKKVDYKSPVKVPSVTTQYRSLVKNTEAQPGDKILCDTCTLSLSCKYFRVGSACSVPGTDSSDLVKAFKSRDANKIIGGLASILSVQTERAERAIADEEQFGELDPQVTNMLNSLFKNGVQLAKLVDPSLNGGTKVAIGINTVSAASITAATPNQFVAEIIADYERQGIKREKITPKMIEQRMAEATLDVEDGEIVD